VADGTLAGLARWPVKSLGGEPLEAARLGGRGVGGDRIYALLDRREGREGRWLTVRQAPRLLAWSATYPEVPDDLLDPADPPPPTLRAPDGAGAGTTRTWPRPWPPTSAWPCRVTATPAASRTWRGRCW
jgi:MOSC domain-containing protein